MDEIAILTTGGTIDKVYFDALSEYHIGDTVVGRLLKLGRVQVPVRISEVMRKDSIDLDDADRAAIASAVRASDARRVIVTHGTDTMTHTAGVLRDIPDKTIVLVGALAPARFAQSDASFNLGMAMAAVQTAGPGVWITMNGRVFAADRVRKDRAANGFVDL